jgi:membrane-bound lytic murein transglycosylase D
MFMAAFCTSVLGGCNSSDIKRVTTATKAPIAIEAREPAAPSRVAGENARVEETVSKPALLHADVKETGNTWDRIQSHLSFEHADNADVRRELQWYRDHPRYLQQVTQRARPYLRFIADEIEERDLPGELALLPILESGFRPDIASPYGAAGLWQFMAGTGTKFGLEVNRWYDGRMDVTRSTSAALSYLGTLHDRFNDDWLIAIAAYNAGWGNLERVLIRQRRLGRPTDFWSLPVSKESRSLVARMVALSIVFKTPERYGLELGELPDRPYFASVELDKPTDLQRFRAALGISREEFAQLNAAYRRGHTGSGKARILVPVAYAEKAEQLAASDVGHAPPPAIASATLPSPAQVGKGGAIHHVTSGESLWTIAKLHRITMPQLAAANGLSMRATLRVGQRLRVPGNSPAAATGKHTGQQLAASRPIRYRVRHGDSLWTISRQFKVSVEQLLAWNGLNKKQQLQPGQELVVSRPS